MAVNFQYLLKTTLIIDGKTRKSVCMIDLVYRMNLRDIDGIGNEILDGMPKATTSHLALVPVPVLARVFAIISDSSSNHNEKRPLILLVSLKKVL
jgi:hypothetical protein